MSQSIRRRFVILRPLVEAAELNGNLVVNGYFARQFFYYLDGTALDLTHILENKFCGVWYE